MRYLASIVADFWIRIGENSYRAPDMATVREWGEQGRFGREDLIWDPSVSKWVSAHEVWELRSLFYPPGVVHWKYDLFLQIWPLYFVIIGLFGFAMILFSASSGFFPALWALRWKATDGHITRSTVTTEQIGDDFKVTRYRADVRYEYGVGGRAYSGHRLALGEPEEDSLFAYQQQAESKAARFQPGDRVTVYFDPDNPSNATLDRAQGAFVAFVMGVIAMAGALFVLRAWWRSRRKTQETVAASRADPFST
jgi:hypothetical protein